jgi:DNA-binding NarL/FixJ family response regulator
MSCVLIYSKNTLYRECLGKIINDYKSVNFVVSIDNVAHVREVYETSKPDYIVVDFYSRNFEENILSEILDYFDGSQLIMVTTKENRHLNFYNVNYGINYFIYAEDSSDVILNGLSQIFNGNGVLPASKIAGLLTARECEILRLIATGKTSKEIAEMLCISKNTVDTHRNKMLQKLNIANSASLVHFAYKSGLL